MKNVGQSVECVICEFIMKEVDQQIGDNATEVGVNVFTKLLTTLKSHSSLH